MAGLSAGRNKGALTLAPLKGYRERTPEEIEAEQAANAAADYSDFGGGLAGAARGMVGSTKAYAASWLDAMGAKNAARGLYDSAEVDAARAGAISPEIATTDQITDGSTLGRYVAGKLGQGAGSIPLGLAGGVGGRLLTRSGAGAALGAGAAYQPVMAGGHVQELNANPNTAGMDAGEKFARGTIVGTGQAAVEGLGPAYMANRLFKRNAPATSLGGAARNFGADVLKGSALEGGGAAVSDVLGQGGMMHADPTVQFDGRQTFEAGIGEAVGGAGFAAPGAAVANTLDYANAGKDLAAGATKNVADATASSAPDIGNPMSGALDTAKGVAQNFADAGAMFKNTAAGYLKHPELAKLVAAQELPPEMEGKSQGEIIDWLAQDSGARHRAALQIAQRTLIDREASDSEKAVAQQLLDNPTDPESWKPFADGMIAKHQIDRLGGKLGQAASELTKWVEEKRGKSKSNLERTPKDEADEREFISAMRRPIETAIGLQDSDTIVRIGSVLQNWVQNGFTPGRDGQPRIPSGLIEALGPKAHDVIAAAYATRARQGKPLFDGDTRSPMGRKADEARALEAVKSAIARKIARNDVSAGVVMKYLTPTMYEQVTPESYGDIAEAVQYYLQNAGKPREDHTASRTTGRPRMQERNVAFEEEMQRHFGANTDAVLEEIALLDKSAPQSSLGRGMADAAASVGQMDDVDGLQVAAEGETGSDADMTLEDSYNGGFTELNPDEDVRYLHKGQKKQAFDAEDAFLDKNIDLARQGLTHTGRRLEYNKMISGDQLKLDRVGVMDYASETGDRTQLDALIAKHPHLSHEQINQRFFVLKNEASEVDQGEAIDVNPEDLNIPRGKKGSWQASTRIDRPPEKGGNKDVSTLANGRLYLSGDGHNTPFVTSSRVLISNMWNRKKLGAFDEGTADKVGADDKLAMFSAGLTSLLDAGGFAKIEIKTPDGEMYQVDSADDLPDDFVIWDSNDPAARLTLGAVKGRTNRGIRARKQKKLKGVEPLPRRESDRVSIADIPDMTRTELRDAIEEMMGAFQFVRSPEAREALKAKLDAFNEAYGKRVTERAPGGRGKEQALEPAAKIAGTQVTIIDRDDNGNIFSKATAAKYAGKSDRVVKQGDRWVVERDIGHKVERKLEHLTETEEMSAAVKESVRKFDEETGLEIQPHDNPTKGLSNFLQQRVTKLRAEYKELAEQVASYEAKEGKNVLREAALKRGHAKLAALVEQGKKLAAELAKLPPVTPKPTSSRAKEAAAEQKRKDALKPAFLRDTQGESASTPATDAKAARDIAYLEATIAAHHGEKSAAGVYEAATLPDHAALDQIAKAFGARVRGFKVTGDKAKYGFFSGVYQGGNRDVVYLSDAAKRPHMALLGHELVHQMKKTNPALYAKFEAAVSKHIKPEAYKAWSKMFPETGDKLREEFMAEVVSDGMMDRTFWEALAKKDVSLAKQVYASVMRLFKQIMASVGYTPKTKSVLDDYAAVMKIAGEVMAEHGATSLRTMNENTVRTPDGAKFHRNANEIHEALGKQGFAATHDSPIKHEGKFNWRKFIGKGEGNAAFGAGTYLSTADGVHRSYKEMFTATVSEDASVDDHINKMLKAEKLAVDRLAQGGQVRFNDTYMTASSFHDSSPRAGKVMSVADAKRLIDDRIKENSYGSFRQWVSPTYQVSVNIKTEELLDWDKPLSGQSELVKKALGEAKLGDTSAVALEWERDDGELHAGYGHPDGSSTNFEIKRPFGGIVELYKDGEYYGQYRDVSEAKMAAGAAVGVFSSGEAVYVRLVEKLGSQAAASDYLQSLGILGHKYNAAGGKESEFPNYVIYDDSKIETNFVEFNLENPTGKTMTTEQKAEVSKYIEKTLGPKVMQFFTDQLKGSGEWSRDAKNQNATIRIATTALNPLSVAHHEAMHEFFQRLLDGKYERAANVLRNAADSPLIKRQLQRHFAGQDAVLEQIENDVEERIAYMFQLWASGKLDIGTQTETVFRKIINVIRKTLGLVSQEKQLEEILQSFHDGKMAEPSAMAQVLDSQEARAKYLKKIGKKANPALKKANEWVGFAENALTGSKNPHLDAIGRTLNNKTGSKRDAQGFLSAKEQANNLYMNKFANALRGIDPTGKDKSVATKADVDLALEGLQTKTWHKDPLVLRIQQQVQAALEEMYEYMDTAGVKVFNPETKEWDKVGKIKDYRIPRSWDPAKIIEHSGKFKEMLLEHHELALEKIAEEANAEIAAGKDAGDYTASWEKRANGDKTAVTAEDVATAIVNRLINSNGQNKLKESETALGFSPFAKSVNEQSLWWIDEKLFAEFMEKDITKIISTYVGQITKRAEYSRRFGADGEVLQKAMDKALIWEIDDIMESKYGVKNAYTAAADKALAINEKARIPGEPLPTKTTVTEQLGKLAGEGVEGKDIVNDAVQSLEPARRAIMAMEGTLGHDISVMARKASAYTIVYQNVRLLGYALFANLIDPLGMMVRGAEFKDAYGAFKRGMRDVTREWGDLTGIRKAKDSDRDDAVRVAEMIGTVDSSGFMSQMGTIYSSQYLPEWAKNVNDTFFRWNGLEAFNKSMRVGATQAAISFIKRHYESPNEHSERYFEELGLTRADVQLGPNGELNVENRQVQQAVMRWVDGAILRPNAAIRPTMSSDPHYAVFYHLKQFMYAMHAVILKRVQIEIKNGNSDPLILLMAGYVPMMLAADSAKGLIQEATGNGQPYWQHDSIGGVVAHGVERAGLLGVGQLLTDTVNYGPLGLLGPAVEQAADLVTQPLGESVADATMVGPFSMALRGPDASSGVGEGA